MDKRHSTDPRCRKQPLSSTPHPDASPPRAVSLRFELDALRDAVEAARMLADATRHRTAGDDYDECRAPDACAGVLALVEARMQLLGLAIQGEASPQLLLAHHNAVAADAEDDILLPVGGTGGRAKP